MRRPLPPQGSLMLKDWLQCNVSAQTEDRGKLKKPKVEKWVSFADLSRRCVYNTDSSYEAVKSYNSRDRKIFCQQAIKKNT